MKSVYVLLGLVFLAGSASPILAQSGPPSLSQLSIEDLMKVTITSASRKPENAADVAAAVFVISRDDIRRSGMTSIPDLLRMVPGLDVAQINSNKWAVSVRGFNGLYANKLLVLVDGRSVYNQLFSGVLWDSEDMLIDDIDRIEVIRGPVAAMWGANAVNGVINIVTKSAAETQGGAVRLDAGQSGAQGAVRYGGTLGAVSYRVFTQWTSREQSVVAPGVGANDPSDSATAGFRADWTARPGAFTLEGAFSANQAYPLWPNLNPLTAAAHPIATDPSEARGGHIVGRWSRSRAIGTSLQVQSFADFATRDEAVGNYRRHTLGVDSQVQRAIGRRQELVAGAGYRLFDERFDGRVGFTLIPAHTQSSLVTAFLMDQISIYDKRLTLTFGSQVQYDSNSGVGVQPTVRLMWRVSPGQRVWAATSRALRTPSLQDQGIRVDYPPVAGPGGLPLLVRIVGNPNAKSEEFADVEAGYRIEIGKVASLDVTGFAGRNTHLVTQEPGAPVFEFDPSPHVVVTSTFANLLSAKTRGLEVAGQIMPSARWRFDGSLTLFRITPSLSAESLDPGAATMDGNAPRVQWHLGASFSPTARSTVEVAFFHAGALSQLQVPAYTRADVNVEWRLTRRISIMAIGQNLLSAAHPEFAGTSSLLLPTQVPRSASLRLRWAF